MSFPKFASVRDVPTGNLVPVLIGGAPAPDLSSYVQGPGSAVDNAIAVFDGTSGKLIKTSLAILTGSSLTTNVKLILPDGSVGTPSLSFASDANTGLYYSSGAVVVAGGGINFLSVGGTQITAGRDILPDIDNSRLVGNPFNRWAGIYAQRYYAEDGSAGTPAYTFQSDGTTGIFYASGTVVGVTGDGLEIVRFQAPSGANPQILAATGTAALPPYGFITESGSGMYLKTASKLGFATNVYGEQLVIDGSTGDSQVLFASGSSGVPGIAFIGQPDTGMDRGGVIAGSDLTITSAGAGLVTVSSVASSLLPGDDNTVALGTAAFRWSDVFAVQTTIGDLTMKNPNGGPEHWKLIEGLDEIWAYNIRTNKKYKIAMEEVPVSPADLAKMQDERARFV